MSVPHKRGEYTKHTTTRTIWYCSILERWIVGQGRRLELLVVTPDSIECRPLPPGPQDDYRHIGRALREAYNDLDLIQRPVEVRTNDLALYDHLKQHMRGVACQARYQRYWVRLEAARRHVDWMYGYGGARFKCGAAERRRLEVAQHETRVEALLA